MLFLMIICLCGFVLSLNQLPLTPVCRFLICQLVNRKCHHVNYCWRVLPNIIQPGNSIRRQQAIRGLLARFKTILTGAGQQPANWLMMSRLSRYRVLVNHCIFWVALLLVQSQTPWRWSLTHFIMRGGLGHWQAVPKFIF